MQTREQRVWAEESSEDESRPAFLPPVFLCRGCLTVLSLCPSQGAVLHGERRDFSAGCCATGECVLSTETVALLWAGSSRVLFLNLSK